MDTTDLIICKALIRDARMPYQKLAKLTGLSAVAVHKRVQELVQQGVIAEFRAEIDPRAAGGISIMVFGRSETTTPTQLCEELAQDERTSMVLLGSGNYLYVGAILRSVTELEPYLQRVREVGKMPQAVAGLHTVRPSGEKLTDISDPGPITPLEMRIIASLYGDARKRTTEVAEELGVSARTVAAKLERMVTDHKVLLTIRWRPDFSNDTVALFHLNLKPGASKPDAINLLHGKYADNIVFFSSFGNLPEIILATIWTRSPKEVSSIADRLMKDGFFESVTPNIICAGYFCDTWKEKMLEKAVKKPVP